MPAHIVQVTACVCRSPAVALVYEGVNELVQEGWETSPLKRFPVDLQGPALFVCGENDTDVIGVLVYEVADFDRLLVTLIYVEASSRRNGICYALIYALRRLQASEGFRGIDFSVNENNARGMLVARKLPTLVVSTRFSVDG